MVLAVPSLPVVAVVLLGPPAPVVASVAMPPVTLPLPPVTLPLLTLAATVPPPCPGPPVVLPLAPEPMLAAVEVGRVWVPPLESSELQALAARVSASAKRAGSKACLMLERRTGAGPDALGFGNVSSNVPAPHADLEKRPKAARQRGELCQRQRTFPPCRGLRCRSVTASSRSARRCERTGVRRRRTSEKLPRAPRIRRPGVACCPPARCHCRSCCRCRSNLEPARSGHRGGAAALLLGALLLLQRRQPRPCSPVVVRNSCSRWVRNVTPVVHPKANRCQLLTARNQQNAAGSIPASFL